MKKAFNAARIRSTSAALAAPTGRDVARGFRPAFFDFSTCTIHLPRFADGRFAPLHLLEGLPPELVAKGTLVAGFERGGFFYTRSAVARACAEWRY